METEGLPQKQVAADVPAPKSGVEIASLAASGRLITNGFPSSLAHKMGYKKLVATTICEHVAPSDWKRLRCKKGTQHFICLQCGAVLKTATRLPVILVPPEEEEEITKALQAQAEITKALQAQARAGNGEQNKHGKRSTVKQGQAKCSEGKVTPAMSGTSQSLPRQANNTAGLTASPAPVGSDSSTLLSLVGNFQQSLSEPNLRERTGSHPVTQSRADTAMLLQAAMQCQGLASSVLNSGMENDRSEGITQSWSLQDFAYNSQVERTLSGIPQSWSLQDNQVLLGDRAPSSRLQDAQQMSAPVEGGVPQSKSVPAFMFASNAGWVQFNSPDKIAPVSKSTSLGDLARSADPTCSSGKPSSFWESEGTVLPEPQTDGLPKSKSIMASRAGGDFTPVDWGMKENMDNTVAALLNNWKELPSSKSDPALFWGNLPPNSGSLLRAHAGTECLFPQSNSLPFGCLKEKSPVFPHSNSVPTCDRWFGESWNPNPKVCVHGFPLRTAQILLYYGSSYASQIVYLLSQDTRRLTAETLRGYTQEEEFDPQLDRGILDTARRAISLDELQKAECIDMPHFKQRGNEIVVESTRVYFLPVADQLNSFLGFMSNPLANKLEWYSQDRVQTLVELSTLSLESKILLLHCLLKSRSSKIPALLAPLQIRWQEFLKQRNQFFDSQPSAEVQQLYLRWTSNPRWVELIKQMFWMLNLSDLDEPVSG